MSTIKSKSKFFTHYFGATPPYGNCSALTYHMSTNKTGAVNNSDSAEATKPGDVIDLGELLEGFCLTDAQLFVVTAMSAGVTGSLGFAYEDGEDDTKVPQSSEYFFANKDLATVSRIRADGSRMDILPKPARLILTLGGSANAQESEIRVAVTGELTGFR